MVASPFVGLFTLYLEKAKDHVDREFLDHVWGKGFTERWRAGLGGVILPLIIRLFFVVDQGAFLIL